MLFANCMTRVYVSLHIHYVSKQICLIFTRDTIVLNTPFNESLSGCFYANDVCKIKNSEVHHVYFSFQAFEQSYLSAFRVFINLLCDFQPLYYGFSLFVLLMFYLCSMNTFVLKTYACVFRMCVLVILVCWVQSTYDISIIERDR